MKNIRINCSACFGKGVHTLSDGKVMKCSVCHGSGRNYTAEYKEKHKGNNACKYCGEACYGYACKSCLDIFEKEKENEEIA